MDVEKLDFNYERFNMEFDKPINTDLINGEALFCYWNDSYPAIHLRIQLKDKISDEIESKYRKELSCSLGYEAENRQKAGKQFFGGGFVTFEKGIVKIKWLAKDVASKAMDDDLYKSMVYELENKYYEILKKYDFNMLYEDTNLSGIFLAKPDRSYVSGNCKVMVVGQETKKWRNDNCDAKNVKKVNIDSVRSSMNASLEFNKKPPKRSKFRQFYKKVSKSLCKDNLDPNNSAVWANQFCISYKSGNPVKSNVFETIKELSSELLKAQLEILNPDVVFFTTGSGRDKYIKDVFDYETIKVIEPLRFWHFKIGDINCFRTNHPRSTYSHPYLQRAIELAKETS